MRLRLLTATLAVCLCAAAATSLTVEQLVSFVRSSIELKHPDKQLAAYLQNVKLTQKLERATVEQLRAEGAGPKTVESLERLAEESKSLTPPAPVAPVVDAPPEPPPSDEEQGRVLQEVRDYAMSYSKSLPDFITTQVTRRYVDPRGGSSWILTDTLTTRLSYYNQKEDYKLVMVNNQMTQRSYRDLGGATSSGEFGSMMNQVFRPKSETRFQWDHWGTLRKRRTFVFKYYVSQLNSEWSIDYQHQQTIVVGYRGLVYVDKGSHKVLRITQDCDIPPTFPVREAKVILDYDYVDIGGSTFLLPLKAVFTSFYDGSTTRNDVEFRLYRKFSAEAEIKFDTPAPLSEDQTKEQAAPKPKK
jgi:hypothetical protein